MCQQGPNEITYCLLDEKEKLQARYEAYVRGDITITDDELQDMAVRMIMIKDALY